MKKALIWIAWIIAAVPVLVVGQCMYDQVGQRSALESLCAEAKPGGPVKGLLEQGAANPSFRVRTGGAAGKNDNEWFDREYLRLGVWLKKEKGLAEDDYSVIFAKPGIGYLACFVIHKDGVIKNAWYEDRGD